MDEFNPIKKTYRYGEYELAFDFWAEHNESSHIPHDPALSAFTKLNWTRTHRIQNTVHLNEDLVRFIKELKREIEWRVITESWCGDSAQSLPVLGELARLNPDRMKIFIYMRDQNLDLMDQYLTNGSRSIPIFILIDKESNKELGVWGPRPKPAQNILLEWKREKKDKSWEDFERELHTWYAKDKSHTIQLEWLELLQNLDWA